jgi:hypothetical protein
MITRRQLVSLGTAALLAGPAIYSLTRRVPIDDSVLTLISGGYHLDKIYHSMEGPWSVQKNIQLTASSADTNVNRKFEIGNSVVWLTGIETEVVDANQEKPVSPEFFCHANLTFSENNPDNAAPGRKTNIDSRLFTLAPGRTSIELPPGFGLPVRSDASLDYLTMSLNLNQQKEAVDIRMRTKLHTIAADQSGAPTKALFRRAVYVLQHEGPSGTGSTDHKSCNAKSTMEPSGLGCGEWTRVSLPNGSTMLKPIEGMTNHWTVPQGDHVYTSEITPQLNLPFDTTVHYATIHVHPFARWMELRDLTTGKTVLHLTARDWSDRIGVAHVDEFKSIDGIPIVRSHRYELAVEYKNSSDSDSDAMAILYLYLLDKNATQSRS